MQPFDLDQAIAAVLAGVGPLPAIETPVALARGGVLAAPLRARWRLPLGDTSMMDGWAVRAADLASGGAVRLARRSESAAGRPSTTPLGPGEAARISTGALVPDGADAVVAQEDVDADAAAIVVDCGRAGIVRPGHFIRRAGSEVAADEPLLAPGVRLGPPELALLASTGHPTAPVHRRPRVRVICTGDELVAIGATPAPGQVISTNGMMLVGLVRDLGADACELEPLADDRQATVDGLRAALAEADVLITSGGISVGDHDHVGGALRTLGLSPAFTRLNLKPGRPLTYGRLGDAHVFALPGNPASTYVTFELIVRPLLCRLLGLPLAWRRPRRRLVLSAPARGAGRRLHVVRGIASGEQATPLQQQVSGSLRSLAGHNALLLIPPGVAELPAGAEVTAILTDPEAAA
ncbi:MAG: molybdopterin molybdotransferase MoeA [Nannocystaceae bacterium]